MPPSPLTTTLIQSTILNAISNLLAQIIDQHKKNKPFTLNVTALIQFITYAVIIVPVNYSWQRWLEIRYPGFPSWGRRSGTADSSSPSVSVVGVQGGTSSTPLSSVGMSTLSPSVSSDAIGIVIGDRGAEDVLRKDKEKKNVPGVTGRHRFLPRKRSGLYNFAMKFMFDQTVGSVMNIVLFIILINLLKGIGLWRIWELVCEDFTPIMIARLKYRPLVSTLMYTVIPLDRRVVFGSACGVVWGVYLSLYAVV